MAIYGTKYYAFLKDFSGNTAGQTGNTYTVNLKYLNYTGTSSQIRQYSLQPLFINYASNDNTNSSIHGSDLTFTFWCEENADYTDLLESEYKDWQIEILRNGSLYWKGWIQPDYITARFAVPAYFISLSATDGLADLKNIPFPSTVATGFTTYIKLIKTCLAETGIELDIVDQVNIAEQNIAAPLFKNLLASSKRFIDTRDGVTKYVNCYEVLNRLLNPFNSKLIQADGSYHIVQQNEINSNRHTFDYTALTASTTTYNREVDVTYFKQLFDSDILSKVRPLKKAEVQFRNKNIGSNVVPNGTFDTNSNWTNGTAPNDFYLFTINNGKLTTVVPPSPLDDPDDDHYFTSDNFSISPVGTGNTITFSVDINVTSMNFNSTPTTHYYPDVRFQMIQPDTSTLSTDISLVAGSNTYTTTFNLTQTGNHKLRLWIIPDSMTDYISYSFEWDNVTGVQRFGTDTEVTYDKYYLMTNTGSTAIQSFSDDIYFSDTQNSGDLGVLKYSSTGLTSSWSSYNTGQTQFDNYSFDEPSIAPWTHYGGAGTSWNYLVGLSNEVRANGIDYSQYLAQGPFRPGTYEIPVTVKNDNTDSGLAINGYISLVSIDASSGATVLASTGITRAIGYVTVTLTVTITENLRLGFYVYRVGPGSHLDMYVSNIEVNELSAPDYNVPLHKLYLYNKLKLFSRFKNYLNMSLKDYGALFFYHVLKIRSKKYLISGARYDLVNGIVEVELMEYLNDEISTTFQETQMSTVDGE